MIVILVSALMHSKSTLAGTLVLTDENQNHFIDLYEHLELYAPGLQEPDLTEITQLDSRQWKRAEPLTISDVTKDRHTTWHKLAIQNDTDDNQTLILSNISPVSDGMKVYACDSVQKNCAQVKARYTNNTIALSIDKHTANTILIKYTGLGGSVPGLLLQNQPAYQSYIYNLALYAALIDGALLALIIYTTLLGIKTRQLMYYSYSLLGLCSLTAILLNQKIPLSLVNVDINLAHLAAATYPLTLAAVIQFVLVFTEARKHQQKLYKLLLAMVASSLGIIFLFVVGTPIAMILPVFFITGSIANLAMLYLCLISNNHSITTRAFLAAGISMPALSGLLVMLLSSGVTEASFDYSYVTQGLTVIEMFFYSFAMISSVKHLKDKHEIQMNASLQQLAINETHNKLLAHLNHELRTPLNGILGAAEILIHKSPPRERHIFSMIYHTAIPLKHLIDKMVDVSIIVEDKDALVESRFDLQSLLQECMDIFLPTAKEKNIRLFFTSDHDIANDVTGDHNKLRQILLNLLGNACKFTENGKVWLSVARESNSDTNKCIYHFEIKDSGSGISEDQRKKLFDAFETHNSTANPKGTGLGLSIVMKLSKILGGNCGHYNNSPTGSVFWFNALLEPHQNIRRKSHSAFDNMRILVADESSEISESLILHISDNTQDTAYASSSSEIELAINARKFDAVIMQNKLVTKKIINKLKELNIFYLIYADSIDDASSEKQIESDEIIIRKTSIESFSLQIADLIITRSNLIANQTGNNNKKEKIKILVAEDIKTNQIIIREIIQSLGMSVEICSNGRQAVSLYKEHLSAGDPFDAIIMDCEMPIEDGFEATKKIRAHEIGNNTKKTPIIALTAHTESAYRERSEKSGMDAYLTKPVTAERILQCLIDQGCI